MKQIIKRPEPVYFAGWKDNFRNANGREPVYADFRGTPEWEQLILDLLKEQGYICCYCMKSIEGWDSHIEHFVPRSIQKTHPHSIRAQDVQLSYLNMFESCNGEENDWKHCGRYKDDDKNPMLVSPTESDIEQRFKYDLLTGEIDAACSDDQAVMATIQALNLNTHQLCQHRLTAFYCMEQKLYDGWLPKDLVELYSSRNEDDAFEPFCAAVVWALENVYLG